MKFSASCINYSHDDIFNISINIIVIIRKQEKCIKITKLRHENHKKTVANCAKMSIKVGVKKVRVKQWKAKKKFHSFNSKDERRRWWQRRDKRMALNFMQLLNQT
jgi:hypothetical protein